MKLASIAPCEAIQCLRVFRQCAGHLLCHDSDRDGGSEEDINKHEPNPVLNFAEAHTVLQTVKSYFYAHNISKRDENILNMKRMKQLSVKVFFGGGGG